MNLARLKRRAHRRMKAPSLDDAIFGGRWPRFLLRRSGFPVARALLSALLHLFEAAAMAMLFAPEYLTPLVTARLTLSISSGVLWAGTEGVRRDVRAALGAGARSSARSRLKQALRRGWLGSALVLIAGVYYLYASPHRPGYVTVVDAYILASCLRIAFSFPVRVMQAGAHAVRRVYRPFASFLLPDILDALSIFLLWRWFGPWSVPIGMVLVGLLKLAITWRYTASTLRQLDLAGASTVSPDPTFRAPERPTGSSLFWWIAGAAQTAPSWIVLGLWNTMGESESMAATLWVLYAIRPIAALLPRLGGVFYVDLVRARRMGELAELRLLHRLRWSLGGAGLCLGIVVALASQDLILGTALLSFYAVNGLFGLESVRVVAFARPIHSLAPTLLAVFPATLLLLDFSPILVVGAAAAIFGVGFLFLRRVIPRPDPELDSQRPTKGPEQGRPLSLLAWLSLEGRGVTTFLECSDSHSVARHLATDPQWRVTRLDRTCLLVFGPPSPSWPVATAGLIKRAFSGAEGSPAEGVLALAEKHVALQALATQLKTPVRDAHVVARDLRGLSASVVVLTRRRGSLSGTRSTNSLREARRSGFLRGSREAGALWEDGRMTLIAAVPRTADPSERVAVRELLFAQSVARTYSCQS